MKTFNIPDNHNKNPIICAIDTCDLNKAKTTVEALCDYVGGIKLGSEFFFKHGISGVEKIRDFGIPIFLDIKLHDIPTTVYKASLVLKELKINMCTVHIAGGVEMLKNSVRAFEMSETKVIGVVSLTSILHNNNNMIMASSVIKESGIHGVVCPGSAIEFIRNEFGKDFLIITPGIRDIEDQSDDHKVTISPKQALHLGANHIVIGRPITSSKDPKMAAKKIFEMCNSLSQ